MERPREDGPERDVNGALTATRVPQASLHAYQHVLQARLFDSIPIAVRHRVMFRLHTRLAPTLLRDEALLLPLLGQEKPEVRPRARACGVRRRCAHRSRCGAGRGAAQRRQGEARDAAHRSGEA